MSMAIIPARIISVYGKCGSFGLSTGVVSSTGSIEGGPFSLIFDNPFHSYKYLSLNSKFRPTPFQKVLSLSGIALSDKYVIVADKGALSSDAMNKLRNQRITLMRPYPGGNKNSISIRQAVSAIEKRTGVKVDWERSRKNVGRNLDQYVLQSLLGWIYQEGECSRNIDADQLKRWRQTRLQQLARGELGMIIHQIDILARRV